MLCEHGTVQIAHKYLYPDWTMTSRQLMSVGCFPTRDCSQKIHFNDPMLVHMS